MSRSTTSKATSRYGHQATPSHLSEFYTFVNSNSPKSGIPPQNLTDEEPMSPSASQASQLSSDTHKYGRKSSRATLHSLPSITPSALDLPALITTSEVESTLKSYNSLLEKAARYREALNLVASTAADFGAALEECARCKGSGNAADGLMSAGGLHFLVANHQLILSESIQTAFEVPLKEEIEHFKAETLENDQRFRAEIKSKTRELRMTEKRNAKLSKLRTRNLQMYRNSLMELTNQIDDIDRLKYRYYHSSYDLVQDMSLRVLARVGSVVRAQVEIYEGIARKGWSGGGLDDLIASCPDPFVADEDHESETILRTGTTAAYNSDMGISDGLGAMSVLGATSGLGQMGLHASSPRGPGSFPDTDGQPFISKGSGFDEISRNGENAPGIRNIHLFYPKSPADRETKTPESIVSKARHLGNDISPTKFAAAASNEWGQDSVENLKSLHSGVSETHSEHTLRKENTVTEDDDSFFTGTSHRFFLPTKSGNVLDHKEEEAKEEAGVEGESQKLENSVPDNHQESNTKAASEVVDANVHNTSTPELSSMIGKSTQSHSSFSLSEKEDEEGTID